jgi:JAB1/Mov34/MPN/PAD-1 ubiquitin protease
MSVTYSEYFPDGARVDNIEKQAFAEYQLFRELQETGLWDVNFSILPSPFFRVLAHVPGHTIDLSGTRRKRDNFFFCVVYPRFFGRKRPIVVWPGDSDLPDQKDFRPGSILYSSLTLERHLSRWLGSRFRGKQTMSQWAEYPSVELALQVCTSVDEVLTRQKVDAYHKRKAAIDKPTGVALRPPETPDIAPKRFVIKPAGSANAVSAQTSISDLAVIGKRLDTGNPEQFTGPALYIDTPPMQAIREHICWGRSTPDNRVEQGGLIVGEIVEGSTRQTTAIVTDILPARGTRGSAAYVRFDHRIWLGMFDEFDRLVQSGRITRNRKIIGWYHTHPNMKVFMSGTDLGTQRSLFAQPWNYALVLNPQQGLCACFRGETATPAALIEAKLKSRG